jgi:hypothetical protein
LGDPGIQRTTRRAYPSDNLQIATQRNCCQGRIRSSLIEKFKTEIGLRCWGLPVAVCLIVYRVYVGIDHAGLIPHSGRALVLVSSRDWQSGCACADELGVRKLPLQRDCASPDFPRSAAARDRRRRRYRLRVRTVPSQGTNPGSIPGIATKSLNKPIKNGIWKVRRNCYW